PRHRARPLPGARLRDRHGRAHLGRVGARQGLDVRGRAARERGPRGGCPASRGRLMPGARILVVDAEPAIRLLCRVNLQADGFAVKEAPDGVEAMRIAHEWQPDLILLDVMMPGEDGSAVAERIRAAPALAGVRVLFLTARADVGDHERSRSTGAVGHVTKPFNPSSLGDEVRAALTR